ncbi:glucose PTS transporter subunit EIIB, partial [Klebsiella pneumoniae]
MNKYKNIAVELVSIIGRDNIMSATHCATRLRLQVKDRGLIDDEKIRSVDEVKGVFFNSGQYQVILGTGIVNKVYAEFMQAFNISEVSKDEMSRQGSSSLQAGIRHLSDVFVPIVP